MFAFLDSLLVDLYNAVKALFSGVKGAGSTFLTNVVNAGAPEKKA